MRVCMSGTSMFRTSVIKTVSMHEVPDSFRDQQLADNAIIPATSAITYTLRS